MLAQGYLVMRTRGPAVATETLRRAVEDAGGGATFIRVQSMDALVAPQLSTPRFDALLLSIFAIAALSSRLLVSTASWHRPSINRRASLASGWRLARRPAG